MSNKENAAPQPEPDAGGEWRYVETRYSSEIAIGANLRLRAHWTGAIDRGEIQVLMQSVVSDHNAIPKLVAVLESAMKVVSDRAAGGRMLTTADKASAVFEKCNAALALVKGRRQ